MRAKRGGRDRTSTKAKLTDELTVLGGVLARTRERHGLKQSDVAASLGLPASWLSKIEAGTRRLDAIELLRLARAMRADPCDVLREVEQEIDARTIAPESPP